MGCLQKKDSLDKFDVLSFAVAKKIVTLKERRKLFEKRNENEKKEEQKFDEIERKYEKEYGSDKSKWSKQIVDKMHDEMFGD